MRGIKYLAGIGLLAALLFSNFSAAAMQVPQFDKLSQHDRVTYTTMLVLGAKHAIEQHGDQAKVQKLVTLFEDGSTNGGMAQLYKNLAGLRALNDKNAADPNNKQPAYEVEHAFFVTLKDNGVQVPLNIILTLNKDFKPSDPLRTQSTNSVVTQPTNSPAAPTAPAAHP
jgi:hypothetical protein